MSRVGIPVRKHRKKERESPDFHQFVLRAIRALGRRCAAGDIEALPLLLDLRTQLDGATQDAVTALNEREPNPYSWDEIAKRAGITRQSAWGRWSKRKDEA